VYDGHDFTPLGPAQSTQHPNSLVQEAPPPLPASSTAAAADELTTLKDDGGAGTAAAGASSSSAAAVPCGPGVNPPPGQAWALQLEAAAEVCVWVDGSVGR
jgi:hypothetical protein